VTRSLLVRRLLRSRPAPALSIVLLAFALAVTFTALLTVRASAARAVADTTRADHAGHAFAVQVLDDTVVPALEARDDLLPLWESPGSAATATRQVPVTVRAVSDAAAASGVLVDGERPRREGEATVSAAALRALRASTGDTVTVTVEDRPLPVRISGVTVSPADRREATVVVLAPQEPSEATLWLSNTDVFADSQLRPMLERRAAKARTVEILAGEREAAAIDTLLTALRYSAPAFALLAVCLAGIMLAALHRERRPDVLALAAAGMSTVRGWRLVAVAALWCMMAGSALGATAVLVGCYALRETVSAPLGQQWQSIAVAWPALIAYLLLAAPMALAMAWITSRGRRARSAEHRLPVPAWTGAVLFGLGTSTLVLMATRVLPVAPAPAAGLAAVVGATLLLTAVPAVTQRPALRRLIIHAVHPLTAAALAAAIITFGVAYYAARQEHTAQTAVDENVPYQPPGSLFVEGVNAEARGTIQQQYRALGGQRSAVYLGVAESRQLVRSTNPGLVFCLQQRGTRDPDNVLTDCGPDGTMAPINTIALTDEPATAGLRVDRAFVEDGRAGLLTFPADESLLVSTTATEPAQPDPALGGNLPGAVVGVDSPLARRLGLTPSGSQSLLLLDFAALSQDAQAQMRSLVNRTASTALVGEDRNDTEAQFRAVSTAVSIGATAVTLLILASAGMAFLAAQRDLRRMLGHLGVSQRQRRAVGARMMLLPLAALAVALASGRFSAWLAGVHNDSGFGWLWALPGLAGILICLVLAVAYGRPPRPDTSTGD
jgi:hypothetical protein